MDKGKAVCCAQPSAFLLLQATCAVTRPLLQDKKSSDSIEGAMSVMQINPFLKIAMRQLKGIELKQTDSEVVLVLLSRFSWFRVWACLLLAALHKSVIAFHLLPHIKSSY